MADRATLLPANATWFERTMEQVLASRMGRLETGADIIATMADPYRCPAQYLPWLAWAVAVPYWRTEWPEAVKRELIAQSPAIHRERGFLPGIERGLAAIDLRMDITLWHQMEPPGIPGTFAATIWANNNRLLTAEALADGIAMVNATKRQSQHADIRVGAALDGAMGMVAVAAPRQTLTADTLAAGRDGASAGLGLAAATHLAPRFRATTRAA